MRLFHTKSAIESVGIRYCAKAAQRYINTRTRRKQRVKYKYNCVVTPLRYAKGVKPYITEKTRVKIVGEEEKHLAVIVPRKYWCQERLTDRLKNLLKPDASSLFISFLRHCPPFRFRNASRLNPPWNFKVDTYVEKRKV